MNNDIQELPQIEQAGSHSRMVGVEEMKAATTSSKYDDEKFIDDVYLCTESSGISMFWYVLALVVSVVIGYVGGFIDGVFL